ncbi:MAG: hypothetical protein WBV94_03060 [Blastocatellia bacterium]
MAHDFNNLLTAIIGFSEKALAKKVRDVLNRIKGYSPKNKSEGA